VPDLPDAEFESYECIENTWWTGYVKGAQDTVRMVEAVGDVAEASDLVGALTDNTCGPVSHRFRFRRCCVTVVTR
jgi:hypothetical protein